MSQILPRYFTQKKLHRQAVTIHSKGAFFYLFVLLSSIYGFPLTVQNRESEIVVPLPKRKMDWGQSPAEGVSCEPLAANIFNSRGLEGPGPKRMS